MDHVDWTVFPSARRKIHRTLARPCLLCCGETVAVATRVPVGCPHRGPLDLHYEASNLVVQCHECGHVLGAMPVAPLVQEPA